MTFHFRYIPCHFSHIPYSISLPDTNFKLQHNVNLILLLNHGLNEVCNTYLQYTLDITEENILKVTNYHKMGRGSFIKTTTGMCYVLMYYLPGSLFHVLESGCTIMDHYIIRNCSFVLRQMNNTQILYGTSHIYKSTAYQEYISQPIKPSIH